MSAKRAYFDVTPELLARIFDLPHGVEVVGAYQPTPYTIRFMIHGDMLPVEGHVDLVYKNADAHPMLVEIKPVVR